MAIQGIGAVAGFARAAIACKTSGMWRAIRAHIEGRNAVSLERERRTTLLTVLPALPPGTEVYDLRADGSLLHLRVPLVMRIDAILGGNPEKGTPRIALPAADPPGQGSSGELASISSAAEE
jgi:hypothetical protein